MFMNSPDPLFGSLGSMLRRTHSVRGTANLFEQVNQAREEFHLAKSAGVELEMTETEFILARFEQSETPRVSGQSITL